MSCGTCSAWLTSLSPRGGHDASRTSAKDRVDVGGIALYRNDLSLGVVCEARACVGDDDEPLRHARYFLDDGSPKPIRESEPNRLHGMVELCPRCRDVVPSFSKSDRPRGTDRVSCALRHRCN